MKWLKIFQPGSHIFEQKSRSLGFLNSPFLKYTAFEQALILSAARHAFLRRREDLKRVKERFSKVWR